MPTFRLPHLNVYIYANVVLGSIHAPLLQHQITPTGHDRREQRLSLADSLRGYARLGCKEG